MDAEQKIDQIRSIIEKMIEDNSPGTGAEAEAWRAQKQHEALAFICIVIDEGGA